MKNKIRAVVDFRIIVLAVGMTIFYIPIQANIKDVVWEKTKSVLKGVKVFQECIIFTGLAQAVIYNFKNRNTDRLKYHFERYSITQRDNYIFGSIAIAVALYNFVRLVKIHKKNVSEKKNIFMVPVAFSFMYPMIFLSCIF